MKKHIKIYLLLLILLLILWIPVSLSKILDFDNFRKSILNQPFNISLAHLVIYSLPSLEILVVVLLLINNIRLIGLYLSGFLLSMFTGYISMALLSTWQKMPCGCGLMLSSLSWKEDLWLIFFLYLFMVAVSYSKKSPESLLSIPQQYNRFSKPNLNFR